MQDGSEGLNLRQALGILRRRLPLVVLCVVVVAGVAFGVSRREPKKYSTTASLAFSNDQLSQQVAGLSAVNSGNALTQQASDVQSVKLGDMYAKTASLLGHGLTTEKVVKSVAVAPEGESSVVDVSATSTSPVLAAQIANTYAHQFVIEQQSTNRQYFKSALSLVKKQLAALPPKQRTGPDGVALQNRAESLGLLAELDYGNVQLAQEAAVPDKASSPKTSRNTVLGAFLGLLLGLGLAFLFERLDRRIKGPEELEALYRLPVLGAVPKHASLSRSKGGQADRTVSISPSAEEAFRLIRGHLRFLDIHRNVRTIAVVSAAPNEGTTTIARSLAETATAMGSHVLLIEADLRHPTLAQQCGIESATGLTDILVDAVPATDATQSVELSVATTADAKERKLRVITAGSLLPLNPAALIESRAMERLLDEAKIAYDLILIDTPPLASVSDAFSLLAKVDGVVIVSRVGQSRRDAAEQLRQILESSRARILGLVANCSESVGSGSYRYPKAEATVLESSSPNGVHSAEPAAPPVQA